MKIDDIIKPKGLGVALSVKLISEMLTRKYAMSIKKDIKVGFVFTKDSVIAKVKVPSERNSILTDFVFYDVILEFIKSEGASDTSFREWDVKVFSNCPSFTFGFTYVFNVNDALTSVVKKNKFSKKALKLEPKEKNPQELSGIDKSLWYAVKKLSEDGMFRRSVALKYKLAIGKTQINGAVKSQEEKLEELQKIEGKTVSKHRKDRNKNKPKKRGALSTSMESSSLRAPMKTKRSKSKLKTINKPDNRKRFKSSLVRK